MSRPEIHHNNSKEASLMGSPTYYQVAILILIFTVAIIGNILLILTIVTKKHLRTTGNVFVAGLAVSDIIFILCSVVAMDAGIHGYWRFSPEICTLNAIVITFSGVNSFYHLSVISIHRYFVLSNSTFYTVHVTERAAIIADVLIWVFSLCASIFPGLYLSEVRYHSPTRTCIFSYKLEEHPVYTIFIGVVAILIPFLISFICYIKIYRVIKKTRRTVLRHAELSSMQARRIHQQMQTTFSRFIVFVTFIGMNVPYAIIAILDDVVTHSDTFDTFYMITALLICANSAVNPIIYGALNARFREAYRELMVRMCLCRKKNQIHIISQYENHSMRHSSNDVPRVS